MTQPLFLNFCKWQSLTAGTGAFAVGAAAPADNAGPHDIPANCNVTNGNTYRYYAQSLDGTQTELGRGVYSSGVLTRATVLANSLSTTALMNFSTAPLVDMFPNPQQTVDITSTVVFLASGTRMLFQQAAAPLYWTAINSFNDYAMRIYSGSGGSFAFSGFSSVFSYRTSDGTVLAVSQLAQHLHGPLSQITSFMGPYSGTASLGPYDLRGDGDRDASVDSDTGFTGSNVPHAHTYDMRVAYVDFTLASKN